MSNTVVFSNPSNSPEIHHDSIESETGKNFIRLLVEKATTPFEKLGSAYCQGQSINSVDLQVYLNRWVRVLSSQGDPSRLERYLKFAELTQGELEQMFAPAKLKSDSSLPQWAEMLQKVLRTGYDEDHPFRSKQGYAPVPFEELVLPFVSVFRNQLQKNSGSAYNLFSTGAHELVEQFVLGMLSRTMGEVLYQKFQSFLDGHLGLEREIEKPSEFADDHYYQEFVRSLQRDRLGEFWLNHPMLARTVGRSLNQQVQTFLKLLKRLDQDITQCIAVFDLKETPGKVVDLKLGLSDPHKGGEGVVILKFESGWKVVYKPRDLSIGLAYNKFCAWVNERLSPQLKILTILPGEEYGWIEYAAGTTCTEEAALSRYYERAGILQGITYLLDSTDFHAENVIASGEHPLLVDFETLLQPRLTSNDRKAKNDAETKSKILLESVMRAALLPMHWQFAGIPNDSVSGFGSLNDIGTMIKTLKCQNTNTDRMELVQVPYEHRVESNVPTYHGEHRRIGEYQKEFKAGFTKFYDLLLEEKDLINSSESPLRFFENLEVRFIFRTTHIYDSILKNLKRMKYVRNANVYGLGLELLARAYLMRENPPSFWLLHREEREAMLNGDVPFFLINSNRDELISSETGTRISNYFRSSCMDFIYEKLKLMNPKDLQHQLDVINQSFSGYFNEIT